MIELVLANWIWLAVIHICTHELPMIGLGAYVIYCSIRKRQPDGPREQPCCQHECEPSWSRRPGVNKAKVPEPLCR
jgi:hypothetical protein